MPTPTDYDAWYEMPRGSWIGQTEYRQLLRLLALETNDRILDIGCGTGWFTRHLSALPDVKLAGIDLCEASLSFARLNDNRSSYIRADACALPFPDGSFDRTISMTALCFVENWPLALKEIVRVSRTRFVIGLLNRRSLLWHEKAGDGPNSSYHGANWHTRKEIEPILASLPISDVRYHSAVFLPSGSFMARLCESVLPNILPWGSCLFVSGNIAPRCTTKSCQIIRL